MYKVFIDGIKAHDPSLDDPAHLLVGGVVKKTVNAADSFTFTIYPNNAAAQTLHKMTSEVTVYLDDDQIFHGRILTEETGWNNERQITCEGDLALFNDTVMEPYSYTGSVEGYLRLLVDSHNAQTTTEKQFRVRRVTVTDPNDNIVRSNEDYAVTMAELLTKLPNSALGGYLMVEYKDGVHYLDYLADSTDATNQKVTLSKNLLDFARISKGDGLITALIPLGAKDDETGARITIESVNGGKKYIVDEDAAAEYGLIYGTQVWDDVTVPANLLSKAQAALTDLSSIIDTITLKAVDLSLTDEEIEALGFFQYVTVEDEAHRASGQYLIMDRQYSLSNPAADTLTFGGTRPTISGQTTKSLKQGEQIRSETNAMVEYMTQILTGSKGGYKVEVMGEDGKPEKTLYMDTPDMDTARQVLMISKDGIGFSQNGINGPYTTAWTIDGKFNASVIQTGILQSENGMFSLDMRSGRVTMRDGYFYGSIYSDNAYITGGNIRMVGSGTWPTIKLQSENSDDYFAEMAPLFMRLRNPDTHLECGYYAGGFTVMDYVNNVFRANFDATLGLFFYDVNGNLTKSYPAT